MLSQSVPLPEEQPFYGASSAVSLIRFTLPSFSTCTRMKRLFLSAPFCVRPSCSGTLLLPHRSFQSYLPVQGNMPFIHPHCQGVNEWIVCVLNWNELKASSLSFWKMTHIEIWNLWTFFFFRKTDVIVSGPGVLCPLRLSDTNQTVCTAVLGISWRKLILSHPLYHAHTQARRETAWAVHGYKWPKVKTKSTREHQKSYSCSRELQSLTVSWLRHNFIYPTWVCLTASWLQQGPCQRSTVVGEKNTWFCHLMHLWCTVLP